MPQKLIQTIECTLMVVTRQPSNTAQPFISRLKLVKIIQDLASCNEIECFTCCMVQLARSPTSNEAFAIFLARARLMAFVLATSPTILEVSGAKQIWFAGLLRIRFRESARNRDALNDAHRFPKRKCSSGASSPQGSVRKHNRFIAATSPCMLCEDSSASKISYWIHPPGLYKQLGLPAKTNGFRNGIRPRLPILCCRHYHRQEKDNRRQLVLE